MFISKQELKDLWGSMLGMEDKWLKVLDRLEELEKHVTKIPAGTTLQFEIRDLTSPLANPAKKQEALIYYLKDQNRRLQQDEAYLRNQWRSQRARIKELESELNELRNQNPS